MLVLQLTWGEFMGIIFEIIEDTKNNNTDLIKVLVDILKQAEKEGVEVYDKGQDDSCF